MRAWRKAAGEDFDRTGGKTVVVGEEGSSQPAAAGLGKDKVVVGSWLGAMGSDHLQEMTAVLEEKHLQNWEKACPLCDLEEGTSPEERERPWTVWRVRRRKIRRCTAQLGDGMELCCRSLGDAF